MKYRAYRRKCKKTKDKKLIEISKHNYIVGCPRLKRTSKMKHDWDTYPDSDQPCDYFKRTWRGRRSSYNKKQYAKKLRHSAKLNMTAWKGNEYRKVSGDFWWDYD